MRLSRRWLHPCCSRSRRPSSGLGCLASLQTKLTLPWKHFSLMAAASFTIILPDTKQKCFRDSFRSRTKTLRCWLGCWFPQASIQSIIFGMCWINTSDLSSPTSNLQDWEDQRHHCRPPPMALVEAWTLFSRKKFWLKWTISVYRC